MRAPARVQSRHHTLTGERILSLSPAMVPVAKAVRFSHERWDGAGYPDGLAGESIPVAARIVFVCDAYDAMRSKRGYRCVETARLRTTSPRKASRS